VGLPRDQHFIFIPAPNLARGYGVETSSLLLSTNTDFMKMYLITAYGSENLQFSPILVDEAGLQSFKDRVAEAIEAKRFAHGTNFTKIGEDEITIESFTLVWDEVTPISSFPEIEKIDSHDCGYEDTWFTLVPITN
jgi:hypothetical protein